MLSKEIKFLLTHSSIYGLGTIISKIVAFLLLPLYTRYLTPSDYGLLETIDISNGIIGIVVTVGIAMALSRFYYEPENEKDRNKVVSTTFITYFVSVVFFSPVIFYFCPYFSKLLFNTTEYSYYFKISFTALLFGGFIDIGLMYLRLIKKPGIFISITLTRLFCLLALNILFIVYFKMGVLGILYSSLITRTIFSIILTISIIWRIKLRVSLKLAIDMLKYSLPIIPSKLTNVVVKQSDKYFILILISIADMGIYSLALKLGNAVHTLITIPFNLAYIPRRFEIMGNSDAQEIYSKIFSYYIFVMVYIGLAVSLLLTEIMKVMVSKEFSSADKLIPLVVSSMIFYGCHHHFNFGILYSKKTKYIAYINIFSALLSLILNFFLIQLMGLWGAVISSNISLSLQAFLLYYFSNKFYQIKYEFSRLFYYIFFALGYYLLFRYISHPNPYIDFFIRVMALIFFPLMLFFLRIISFEERQKIKSYYNIKIRPLIVRTIT